MEVFFFKEKKGTPKKAFFVPILFSLSLSSLVFALAMPTPASVESAFDAQGEQLDTIATASGGERAPAAGGEDGGGGEEGRRATVVDGSALGAADAALAVPPPSSNRSLRGPPIVPPPLEGFSEAFLPITREKTRTRPTQTHKAATARNKQSPVPLLRRSRPRCCPRSSPPPSQPLSPPRTSAPWPGSSCWKSASSRPRSEGTVTR